MKKGTRAYDACPDYFGDALCCLRYDKTNALLFVEPDTLDKLNASEDRRLVKINRRILIGKKI